MSTRSLILACLLLAASTAAGAANLYRVEMLVFQRSDNAGGESFVPLPGTAARPSVVGDVSARAVGGQRLGPEAYTLERKGYRTLYHKAWIQAANGLGSQTWYGISAAGVDGAVRLRRGRYLHFDADLLLAGGTRVSTGRRMRSRELHYLDHPRAGILVRVDPAGGAAPAGDAGSAAAPDPYPGSDGEQPQGE